MDLSPLPEEYSNPEKTGECLREVEKALEETERELGYLYGQDDFIDTAAVYGSVGNCTATEGSDVDMAIFIRDPEVEEGLGEKVAHYKRGLTAQRIKENLEGGKLEWARGIDPKIISTGEFDYELGFRNLGKNKITEISLPFTGVPECSPYETESMSDLQGRHHVGEKAEMIRAREWMAAMWKGAFSPEGYAGEGVRMMKQKIDEITDKKGDLKPESEIHIRNREKYHLEEIALSKYNQDSHDIELLEKALMEMDESGILSSKRLRKLKNRRGDLSTWEKTILGTFI